MKSDLKYTLQINYIEYTSNGSFLRQKEWKDLPYNDCLYIVGEYGNKEITSIHITDQR